MPADGAQCAAAPKGYPARDGRAVDEPRRKGGGGERLRIQFQLSAALASASSSAVHEWRINTVTRRTASRDREGTLLSAAAERNRRERCCRDDPEIRTPERPVRAAEHYRQRALECYLIAEGIVDPGKRLAMLELARKCGALAHHAHHGETRAGPQPTRYPGRRAAACTGR